MMGAMSQDHTGLSMDKQDLERYADIEKWKRQRKYLESILSGE